MKNTFAAVLIVMLAGIAPAAAEQSPVTIDDVLAIRVVASPAVSADGRQVIYTVRGWETDRASTSPGAGDRQESRTRVWKVPVAGGPARQIAYGERGDSQPAWSPDGRYISFVSARGASTGDDAPKPHIYLTRADGGEAWTLTDAKERRGIIFMDARQGTPRISHERPAHSDEEAAIRTRDDERVFEGDFRYSHVWNIDIDMDTKTSTRDQHGQHVRHKRHSHRARLDFGGYPATQTMPLNTARSAMTFMDNVETPTPILHGGNDERVPPGQADELFRVEDRGKTTELVFYPREGHGAESYHQRDRLTRIHGWVTRHTLASGNTTTQ